MRETTREVTLGGTTLPARALALLRIGVANRDPKAFERPDTFDLARESSAHIAFGRP